jgi:hypothetical protein
MNRTQALTEHLTSSRTGRDITYQGIDFDSSATLPSFFLLSRLFVLVNYVLLSYYCSCRELLCFYFSGLLSSVLPASPLFFFAPKSCPH